MRMQFLLEAMLSLLMLMSSGAQQARLWRGAMRGSDGCTAWEKRRRAHATIGRTRRMKPAQQQPRSGWWLPPANTYSSSDYKIAAIFVDPHGAVAWVTRPTKKNAIDDGAYFCKSKDPLHQDCRLLDVIDDTCVSYAYTVHGSMSYAADADAQKSARLAIDQCNRFNVSGDCKLLMLPICPAKSNDPNLSVGRISSISREGIQALTKTFAERDR
jgi:hypothetical protein